MGAPATDPQLPDSNRPRLYPTPVSKAERSADVANSSIGNFSIVLGGPVYDLLVRFGLLRFGLPNTLARITALVALTWVPLLLLSIKDSLAFGHRVTIPLLADFSMYGRFLLGLPLLVLAEAVIDPAIRRTVAEFAYAGIVPDTNLASFDKILVRTQRLRDSAIPELLLMGLAFFPVFLFQHEWRIGAVSSWHTTARGLTAAGWWYAVISASLLRFITYRWAFRYFVWSALLWQIGRLHLNLTPTHPDHSAGVGFLSLTQRRFGILFCALGCAFAGRVANGLVFEGSSLASFKLLMVGFVVLSLIVGLLPLTMMAPTLAKVRRAGLLEYGRLSNRYTELFDRKWVHPVNPVPEPLLGTGDIQSLADLGTSFAMVDAMKIAPINKRLILQLAAQAATPLIPVVILGTPTPELINQVLKMVT